MRTCFCFFRTVPSHRQIHTEIRHVSSVLHKKEEGGKKHNNKHTPRFRVTISTRQGSTDTSQEAKSAKKLFHTSHLTSHPLQNYPPQPQGRDCWKRNYLVESLLVISAVNVQDGFVCLFV